MNKEIPVITVDGPSGSGKGTICQMLASRLGFHFLDSGALYRLLGLAARRHAVALNDEEAITQLAAHLDVRFEAQENGETRVLLEGEVVTSEIRTEEAGADASLVAAIPSVREALLQRQRAFAKAPGLVADGRDMGTVVFPEAQAKVFLDASAEVRAERRYNQLIEKGESVTLGALVEQVRARDERDRQRSVSPLVPAEDAEVVDSSDMSIDKVLQTVMEIIARKGVDTAVKQ
ncbi:(d)CMP kinase [Porticoccaceae bacterium LTM1]|nr:(d)CMP kinase [Porticoccaceae bacterium LTM1]